MPVEEFGQPGIAHARRIGDGLPIAAALAQQLSNGHVQGCIHAANLSKLCSNRKQLIASPRRNTRDVAKSINEVLAENLEYFRKLRGFKSQKALGDKAGLSQTAIGYYLHPERRSKGKSGREASAKLAEVEQLARALSVEIWELLRDMSPSEREFYGHVEDAYRKLRRRSSPPAAAGTTE